MRLLSPILAGLFAAQASAFALGAPPIESFSIHGTIIGNAKFVEYSNVIYGVKLLYPEQWNVVDSGQQVNIVAYQSEGVASFREGAFEAPESIDFYFEDRYTFQTFIAFERYVKSSDPLKVWNVTKFKGLNGFKYETSKEAAIVVLRPDKTAMKLTFPIVNGAVPLLVGATIESITFDAH
jgi:hypothetical protein